MLEAWPAAQGPSASADAKAAEELTEKICVECHEFDQVVAIRRTPREWKDMITTMANKGAVAAPDEFATIRQFLTRNYGVVAVNTAAAPDFSSVLGLSQAEADAVVAYRAANGKFANIDALAKVPGLDAKKLAEQTEALRFD